MAERLTQPQHRVLRAIARMEAGGERGHNIGGNLSIHTGNLTHTIRVLIRRGLVECEDHGERVAEDLQFDYGLTAKGKQALREAEGGGSR